MKQYLNIFHYKALLEKTTALELTGFPFYKNV